MIYIVSAWLWQRFNFANDTMYLLLSPYILRREWRGHYSGESTKIGNGLKTSEGDPPYQSAQEIRTQNFQADATCLTNFGVPSGVL